MKHSTGSNLAVILDCLNRGENPTPPDDADGEYIVHGGLLNFGRISFSNGVNGISINNGMTVNYSTINNRINSSPAGLSSEQDQEILRELAEAQARLADREPIIADAIGELREAIVKMDQKTIEQKIMELTSGTVAEIVKNVAGSATLRFLGLS